MKEAGKVVAYAAAVVVLGALAAPPLYWLGQAASGLVPELGKMPFARYFNRSVMLVALALLWPFLRWLGVRRWTELGIDPNPRRAKDLVLGVGLSVPGLWLVAAVVTLAGAFTLRAPGIDDLAGALATGVAVALIEETFFRGALLGALRRSLGWRQALGFVSVVFGVLHFIQPNKGARRIVEVGWLSGFEVLPYAFHRFTDPTLLLVGLLTLVIFGWILGYTVVRTRSLYMAIGLHAGWVFALRAFMSSSKRVGPGSFWLGKDLTTGILPVLLLLGSLGLVWYLLERRERRDA